MPGGVHRERMGSRAFRDLLPGTEIEQGPLWTLAVNANQNLLGKTLVILNRPCEAVDELRDDEWSELGRQIWRVHRALDSLFSPDRYNHAFLMNVDAQVHLHVLPRYRSSREWNGHVFEDAHYGQVFGTEQRTLGTDALQRLSDLVRRHLPPAAMRPAAAPARSPA